MNPLKVNIFTQINSGEQPVAEQTLSSNTGDKTGGEMDISWDDNIL